MPRNPALPRFAALVLLSSFPLFAHAVPQYFIVGSGDDERCAYTSVQAAINAAAANGPGLDYVMVTRQLSLTGLALNVTGQSLLIEGGYRNCDLEDDLDGEYTDLGGNGVDPVVRFGASSGSHELRLSRVRLSGGGNSTSTHGGGLAVDASANTTLVVRVRYSDISANRAYIGGGIHASASGSPAGSFAIIVQEHTRISGNTSANYGGGIYVADGNLFLEADAVDITGNFAGTIGGGVAVFRGQLGVGNPDVRAPRYNVSGARISGNTAGDKGGGIYLTGQSTMSARELAVDDNVAALGGGGIAASANSSVQMLRDYPSAFAWQCAATHECSRLSNNRVGDASSAGLVGGALALYSGSTADLAQTIVLGNSAQDGSAVYVENASHLRTEGVLFTGNRASDLPTQAGTTVRARWTTNGTFPDVRIAYSTFVGNTRTTSSGQVTPAGALVIAQSSQFKVFNSAFFDSAYPWVAYSAHTSDCTIRPDGGLLDGNGTHTRAAATPLGLPAVFVRPSTSNWQPRFDSPLTDYCDASAYVAEYRDPHLRTRCRADSRPDQYGTCEIGAWENDQLFASGVD